LEEELVVALEDKTFFFDDAGAEAFDSTLAIDFLSPGLFVPTTVFALGFLSHSFLEGPAFFTATDFLGAGAGFLGAGLGLATGFEALDFFPRVFFTSFFLSAAAACFFGASLTFFLAYFSSALRSCF
jgi:hypothetical protein